MLELLLEAYPESIYERDGSGLLPVELAFQYSRSNAIVKILCPKDQSVLNFLLDKPSSLLASILLKYPDLRRTETEDTALHCACQPWRFTFLAAANRQWFQNVALLGKLLKALPATVSTPNHSGALPFHTICHNPDAPEHEIEAVFSAHPEAATIPMTMSSHKEWPIHLLLRHHPRKTQLLRKVLQQYPAAIGTADADQNLPLVQAAEHAEFDFVFTILRLHPHLLQRYNVAALERQEKQHRLGCEERQVKRQRKIGTIVRLI